MHHSAVSLEHLEERLRKGAGGLIDSSRRVIDQWRSQGLEYAPPCDNVTPDGRCAGHEQEVPNVTTTTPTPYDDQIDQALEHRQYAIRDGLLHAREGYRRAKAEDTALLEAAKEAEVWFKNFGYNAFGITMSDDNPDHERIRIGLTQAIAKTEGRTP